VLARFVGLEHQRVRALRQQVPLATEGGDPEAVDHVGRGQLEGDGPTDRHVDLVGGREPLLGVADLPPPLVPDDLDHKVFTVVVGLGRHLSHRLDGRCEHHDQDDDGEHHPTSDEPPRR